MTLNQEPVGAQDAAEPNPIAAVAPPATAKPKSGPPWPEKEWLKVESIDLEAQGVARIQADKAFVKAVADKTDTLVDTWAKAAEAKGLKDAKKTLGTFRADIAKLQ